MRDEAVLADLDRDRHIFYREWDRDRGKTHTSEIHTLETWIIKSYEHKRKFMYFVYSELYCIVTLLIHFGQSILFDSALCY